MATDKHRKLSLCAYVHMFPPLHNAGSETTLLAMLRGMVRRGHSARVVASEIDHDYTVDGVEVFGTRNPQESFVREMFEWADVAITHLNMTGPAMRAARDTSKPLVHLVHNHFQLKFHNVRPIRAQLLIYNSEWVRNASPMPGAPSIVMHPIVEPDLYRVPREGMRTTFVNLTVTKGANVFYELAKRKPTVEFIGIRGAYGDQFIPPVLTPNVTIWDHTPDILHAYRQSKVILMPSDYESYGRIAVEAACSGIPSIVHPTDGLLEALGPAGIYCHRDKIEDWDRELTRLYQDAGYYEERSAAARALADSFQPERAFDQIEAALRVVANAGLQGAAWTVEALGEAEYQKRAIEGGYFDPRREPRGFRPPLGDGPMRKRPWTTDRKLCVNSAGFACEAGDPDRVSILVGPGQDIPYERAVALGIVPETGTLTGGQEFAEKQMPEPAEIQAQTAPAENKMVSGPAENKRRPGGRRKPQQATPDEATEGQPQLLNGEQTALQEQLTTA